MNRAFPTAPTTFLVARHLLTNGPTPAPTVATHLQLNRTSVYRSLKHLQDATGLDPSLLVDAMIDAKRRPSWTSWLYQAPNPLQWQRAFAAPSGLSGEHAAEAIDEINLVSDKCIIYVPANSQPAVAQAAQKIQARAAPPSRANLIIRTMDPWMHLHDGLAERGQRYYDYAMSKHIQLRRWRPDVLPQ